MVKSPPANSGDARDQGSIPGSGRSPGEGNGNPLQYSRQENPMDRELHSIGSQRARHNCSDRRHKHITFPGPKAKVFPVVMCGCESWTIEKAECERIDAFEQWCWRRLLTVPWTARRSNQSILKEISPEYSLEGLMLKLKLQYLATW